MNQLMPKEYHPRRTFKTILRPLYAPFNTLDKWDHAHPKQTKFVWHYGYFRRKNGIIWNNWRMGVLWQTKEIQ